MSLCHTLGVFSQSWQKREDLVKAQVEHKLIMVNYKIYINYLNTEPS